MACTGWIMETKRFMADCRKYPSDTHCSLLIAGTEEEVMTVAVEHAIAQHGHARTGDLRDSIRNLLEPAAEDSAVARSNRALAQRLFDAFNKRDFDLVEQCTDANAVMLNVATGETFRGPKGMRAYVEGWARAFPDARVELERVIAGEDGYVSEFVGTGTHKGQLASPAGTLPPTGRRIRQRFAESFSVRDGKLVDGRLYFDLASMLAQLGVGQAVPVSAQAESGTGAEQQQRH
jgi:ketosteroid isomerase-like protein